MDTEAITVSGTGTYATSNTNVATQIGTYTWTVNYSGDSLNNSAADQGGSSEQVTTVKATPSISTTQNPASGTVGSTSYSDTATVSGGYNPTGTVTFNLKDSSGTAVCSDTETLSAGTATSQSYTPAAAGTYYWVATYNGDANNNGVISGAHDEPVTVDKANPSLVKMASTSSITLGTTPPTLSDSATLSGGYNPTGTLHFILSFGGGTVYSRDVSVSGNGTYGSSGYTLPTSGTVTGTYTWTVSYSGDSNNNSASDQGGSTAQTIINPANPSVVTTASADVITLGTTAPTGLHRVGRPHRRSVALSESALQLGLQHRRQRTDRPAELIPDRPRARAATPAHAGTATQPTCRAWTH